MFKWILNLFRRKKEIDLFIVCETITAPKPIKRKRDAKGRFTK